VWWILIVAFVFFRLIAFLPTADINSFAASHYLFSYANGFHKRAFVGAVFGHLFGQATPREIYATSACVLAVFAAGLLLCIHRAMLASAEMAVLAVALLGAPALLPHFGNAIGYFDPILVICALLTAFALDAPGADWTRILLAFVPSVIGVLTHESYLLAAFPLALARGWLRGKSGKAALLTLSGGVFVLTLAVQAFGKPGVPLDTYVAQAATKATFGVNRDAFELLYFNLRENYAYLGNHYASLMTDARFVMALIIPIPYFVMLYDLFKLATRRIAADATTTRVVTLCTLAPLVLVFVGFDELRWVSLSCLICSVMVFECARADASGEVRESLTSYVRSPRFAFLALISFAVAPFHVVDGNGVATGIHALAHGVGLVQW
jgi:hypothetical protein